MSIKSVITTEPCHPLSPSSPAFNPCQHQGLFQWVGSSHQMTKVLELQPQHQSFQWIFRVGFLWDWLVWSPCCPRDSRVFASTSLKASILEVCGIPPGVSGDPLAHLLAVPCHNMALAYSVTLGAPVQQPWTKRNMRKLLGWGFMSHTTK